MTKINPDINYFGKVLSDDKDVEFGIKTQDRFNHMYVVGSSGVGKSELLHNMIMQDVINKRGVALIDPHGDLSLQILSHIPKERLEDVVYFNPADPDSLLAFNPLHSKDDTEKHLLVSGLMSIFTKIWSNSWSTRMEYILNNTLLTLLSVGDATLEEVRRILTDKEFRLRTISQLTDKTLKEFWTKEFDTWSSRYRQEAVSPIINKLGQFLSNPLLRNTTTLKEHNLNIEDIMDNERILIINISKGLIGEDNSSLLGAMILNQMYISIMQRATLQEDKRQPFYLYVDEFQNFATKSFGQMLAEARKYKTSITLANQFLDQLNDSGDDFIKKSVLGNISSFCIFRISAHDANLISKELGDVFEPKTFTELGNYEMIVKLLIDGQAPSAFKATSLPPFDCKKHDIDFENFLQSIKRKNLPDYLPGRIELN